MYADRGYDHDTYRRRVRELGITPKIARRGTEHGSGLGVYRWVAESAFALLHHFRRLRIRWEIRDDIHEALLAPGHGDRAAIHHPCRHRQHRVGVAGQGLADLLTGGQIPHPHRPDVTQGDSNRLTEATAGRGIAPPEATTTTREIQLPLDSRGWRTATTRRPTGGRQPSSFRSARSRCRPATSPRGPNRR